MMNIFSFQLGDLSLGLDFLGIFLTIIYIVSLLRRAYGGRMMEGSCYSPSYSSKGFASSRLGSSQVSEK